jgi:hypothetical protein
MYVEQWHPIMILLWLFVVLEATGRLGEGVAEVVLYLYVRICNMFFFGPLEYKKSISY